MRPITSPLRNSGVNLRECEPHQLQIVEMNMDLNGFTSSGLFHPALWTLAAIAIVILLRVSGMFRYIPNNRSASSKSYGR